MIVQYHILYQLQRRCNIRPKRCLGLEFRATFEAIIPRVLACGIQAVDFGARDTSNTMISRSSCANGDVLLRDWNCDKMYVSDSNGRVAANVFSISGDFHLQIVVRFTVVWFLLC